MVENTAWSLSKLPPPEHGSPLILEFEIKTAFGKHPETVSYDDSLLYLKLDDIAPDSKLGAIENKIMDWQKKQLPVVIMADNDTEFEAQYQILINNMKTLGIRELDAKKNEFYQLNCEKSGRVIEKVNGGNDD
jgi:hypothetical protein